jgi:hypothetical protein
MSVAILLVLAIVASVYAGRQEGDSAPPSRAAWARLIAYWVFTIPVAYELVSGALWEILNIKFIRLTMAHLGYPPYIGYIQGVPRIPFVLAVLLPRFPRLKEWAYAWTFFTYAGVAASQFLVGDGPSRWVPTLVFCSVTLISWALRPPSRRLGNLALTARSSAFAWSVPVIVTAAMLAVAYITLPTGGPPR